MESVYYAVRTGFLCIIQVKLLFRVFNTLCSPVVTIYTTRFNAHKFYVLPTQCIYVFCVHLRTNSHYFPIQH